MTGSACACMFLLGHHTFMIAYPVMIVNHSSSNAERAGHMGGEHLQELADGRLLPQGISRQFAYIFTVDMPCPMDDGTDIALHDGFRRTAATVANTGTGQFSCPVCIKEALFVTVNTYPLCEYVAVNPFGTCTSTIQYASLSGISV